MAGLQLRKQQEKVEEIIRDLVVKEKVPPHRIVLGGVGAGGTVAFTAAMRSKWALRAVFMMGGMLHPSADLFDGPLCRAVPSLLLLHGERDALVPRKTHRLVLRMLSRATVNADVTAAADIVEEICAGCGHEVSTSYAEESCSGDPLSRSLAPPDEDAERARAEAAHKGIPASHSQALPMLEASQRCAFGRVPTTRTRCMVGGTTGGAQNGPKKQ